MALGLSTAQVAVPAGGSGLPRTPVSVAGSFGPSAADVLDGRYHGKGGAVCFHGPVLKSRVSNARPEGSLRSLLSSSYKAVHTVERQQGSFTRVPDNEAHPNPSPNSSALIDIEDSGDGSITFKYGAVEDLWDLDRLLEILSSGAFNSHTAESFVRVVVELFKVPVSSKGQRKIADLLLSQIRLHSCASGEEMEKTISQVLAEAASEFLPPSSVGTYSKGNARPFKRFSSRMDKWWEMLDNYLGVGEGSVDFMPEHAFDGFGGHPMQPLGNYQKLSTLIDYMEPVQPKCAESVSLNTTEFTWKQPLYPMPWLARPSDRLYLEPPKTREFARGSDFSTGPMEANYISGQDFIMIQSQVDYLEDVLRKTEVEENGPHKDVRFAPLSNNVDTIPAASVREMLGWESEGVSVTPEVILPSKQNARVKSKKATQQTRKKTNPRAQGSTLSTKSSATKKKSTTGRNEPKLCDMFFGLPISHRYSGVASVLVMRKNFGADMLVAWNQVAVGFVGAGLAVTLHVVSRMLSVNSTFDSSKLFGLMRGAALMILSAAMQSVRKVMLRLPVGCTVSDFKDEVDLLRLQQQLRRLSFAAMTVMVLTIVGHGV